MIPETETPDFINTLIHEKIHVYQRQNESIIDNVLSDKLKINKVVHSNTKKRANPDLNRNTYKNPNNEIMQCYYNSDNPNSIQDVTCLHNNSVNEHPYEFLAYTIANKYNDYLIKKIYKYIIFNIYIMEHIINQAPENISEDKILEVYIKNSSNVIDTLVELWDIKEEKKIVTDEQQKWNEIRETCDSFDEEMYKQIKGDSNKPIEKQNP